MKGKDKTNRILGFLVAKGLLIAPGVKPYPTVKLTIPDVLEAAELDEPRILEVLPAALLSFPKSFLHFEALPEELQVIIQHIKAGKLVGPDYRGIRYKDMKRWANMKLPDGRTKRVSEKKIGKNYRFSPETVHKLKQLREAKPATETEIIENLILQAQI
jgi:hypothetical protein